MRVVLQLMVLVLACLPLIRAQNNAVCTNPLAERVMLGLYDPAEFAAPIPSMDPDIISRRINESVSPDSIQAYLVQLASFYNRNTASDTNSSTRGIGAARRWVYSKFEEFSARNHDRLIPSYLQFTFEICGKLLHRNIFAVLPGLDTTESSIVIIEAHVDSRCASVCDSLCLAQGMEDNGSGTALVLELARVMSSMTFQRTIVFLITTAEEQGLNGAMAFSNYVKQKGIAVRAVLNNDIVGGVLCGKTASPPGCAMPTAVDSTDVRIFSSGGFNSAHKQLARYVKLQYQEQLQHVVDVPMNITIMTPEDRTGRGGDHIPFRQNGYSAIRFTSANEHGDATITPSYTDRQHTSGDILGVDTDGDAVIDSFYVDFRYCARNAIINGNAAAMLALGPATPSFSLDTITQSGFRVRISAPQNFEHYRVAVRSTSNDWDTVYTVDTSYSASLPLPSAGTYFISVAAVDARGVESLFTGEKTYLVSGVEEHYQAPHSGMRLLQNKPNPFDEVTVLAVFASRVDPHSRAVIAVHDVRGQCVATLPLLLREGMNEVDYHHGEAARGTYSYSLYVDDVLIDTKQMIFAN